MASKDDLHPESTDLDKSIDAGDSRGTAGDSPPRSAGESAGESASEGAGGAAGERAGDSAAAPATKRARKQAAPRRPRKTAAAPDTGPVTGAEDISRKPAAADRPTGSSLADDTGGDAGDELAEAAAGSRAKPTKKVAKKAAKKAAPRKRAARGSVAKPQDLEQQDVEPQDVEPQDVEPQDVEPQPTEFPDVGAKPASAALSAEEVPTEEETGGAEADATATVPSFGLLFQAPEPSVAPRRRATSAAGAPGQAAGKAKRGAAADKAAGPEMAPSRPEKVPGRTEKAPSRPEKAPGRTEKAADETEQTAEPTEATHGAAGEPEPAEQEGADQEGGRRRSRRRGGRGRRSRANGEGEAVEAASAEAVEADETTDAGSSGHGAEGAMGAGAEETAESPSSRRRRRRRRSGGAADDVEDEPGTVTKIREPRKEREEPAGVKGSTRLEAKKQRRREGREAGRRRTIITEAEFLARRESVERLMVVRHREGRTQIGVLEDGVLVEHYVSRETNASMAGNVYLGRVQNVLPSMEAAFVDIGKGRNAVLYAGEVNWDAAGLELNQPKRIENALKSGDTVLVQVTKDPIGHKGARLTSQISLPGRYLVLVPEGSMTGISRKLPDTERTRLKGILKEVVPDTAGVIVRTAAEGASEEELRADVERLTKAWQRITEKAEAKSGKKGSSGGAPLLLHGEPDLTVRVIRDVFNEDFSSLVVAGDPAWREINDYVEDVAPDLGKKLQKWTSEEDLFTRYRVDEQLAKAMDRKVWLPSGGSLVIDRTEAMTVVDVNTGKFVGSGGNLEETVTKNNLEAAEEIVRQLRLRDIGGIIVIDFIDMVLESNRDLVVRRLLECLGRDRTKHQVAEVTSLGLVQMTRKRVGSGLIEVFSEVCEHCNGRGIIVSAEPVDKPSGEQGNNGGGSGSRSRGRRGKAAAPEVEALAKPSGPTPAQIAAAAHAAAIKGLSGEPQDDDVAELAIQEAPVDLVREIDVDDEWAAAQAPSAEDAELSETAGRPEQPESAEAAATAETTAEAARPAEQPAPRKRRRGRVVAPAGPPRSSEVTTAPAGQFGDASTPAEERAAAGES